MKLPAAIRRYSRREDIVLATKVSGKMHDGPGGSGLSRKAIMEQIDASLTRLGTNYVDLYQIHRFDPARPRRRDHGGPARHRQAGKARYLGASSMYAWQFAKLQHAAGQGGWTRFVSMQNQYNLLRRQDEPELMAMCADTGVGLVPYSPQGKGRLARPWGEQSTRSSVNHVVQALRLTPGRARRQRGTGTRQRPRCHHGPGRAGLGAAPPGCLRPDRRRDQTASPARSYRRARTQTDRRRGRRPRKALHQPRAVLVLTSTPG